MLKNLILFAAVSFSANFAVAADCSSADAAVALFAKVHPVVQENIQIGFDKNSPEDKYTILFTKSATVQNRARIGQMTIVKATCAYETKEADAFALPQPR